MASVAINRLMSDIRVRLPGALDDAIQYDLFTAVASFLETSGVWREILNLPVTTSTSTYIADPDAYTFDLLPPAGSKAFRLLGTVDADEKAVDSFMAVRNKVRLARLPDAAAVYKCLVVLTVDDPVTRGGYPVCPDWVYSDYKDTLMYGVLASMMSQMAKPYSNPQLAGVNLRMFSAGCSKARIDAERQNVQGGQNWRFPQSYASIRMR